MGKLKLTEKKKLEIQELAFQQAKELYKSEYLSCKVITILGIIFCITIVGLVFGIPMIAAAKLSEHAITDVRVRRKADEIERQLLLEAMNA